MPAASVLTLEERENIEAGIKQNKSGKQIASMINRMASTLTNEIKRNGGKNNYNAKKAHERALYLRKITTEKARQAKIVNSNYCKTEE